MKERLRRMARSPGAMIITVMTAMSVITGMMMRTVTTIATIMMTTKAESDSQQELFHVPEAGCVAER